MIRSFFLFSSSSSFLGDGTGPTVFGLGLISSLLGTVQMGVEVALLTAVNPALLSNTAIADTAGEDPVTVLGLGN